MAQHRRCGFPSITMPCLAQLAVTALMMLCAASTATAQPQTLPPLPVLPQPTTTTATPAAPAVPSQLPAPCPPAQATLAPCLRFFTGTSNSSASSPPAECCAQIRAMFQSQAPCLCAAMASGPAAQLGGLGAALGQLLPSACDLPANACLGTTATGGGAPADPTTTTPATGSGATDAPAAPETGPNGADTTAPGVGGAGVKSVPGLLGTGAAAPGSRGVSAAGAVFMSLLVVYLLSTIDRIMHC